MLAEHRGDPLIGTAFPAARVLLVEQPGPWGRAGLAESRFDPAVARTLHDRADAAGIRVLAIRRPGRTLAGSRRWALADTRDGAGTLRVGTFDADAELADLPLDGSAGEPDDAPLYLVCTHSKHDTCCALRGRPVAAALHDVRPGQVWECSHIGGERFAANILLLPSGLVYGRVAADDAAGFVATHEAGEVVGALLRGRIGLPPAAQVAFAFAYEQLGLRDRDALRVLGTSPLDDGRAQVALAAPGGRVQVTLRRERVAVAGLTCADLGGQTPRPGHYLTWRPELITEA